ncbi:MAG: restriction endonuclease subunit S [Magnetospirillum sp.]|nr:restriction endonuclease subunit S [Magnetospirillum sp.]
MGFSWREVELRRLLRPSFQWTEIVPTNRYQQVTVRLWGKGVVPRGEVAGSEIAAAQQRRVKSGQFIISKIDARNGAFGLVPAELDGAVVSNDFPVFDIDKNEAEPGFVEWLSKTSRFVDLCRRASEGSTNRVRLTEERFLGLTMTIPSLEEQRRIVARLDRVERLVQARQAAIDAMDNEAEAMLRSAFDRLIDGAPPHPMAEVAPLVRRPVAICSEGSYPELGVRSFGRGTFHKPPLAGAEVGTKRLFFIKPGDLVFNIVFAWEGAVAVATENDEGRVGSHRFLTCVPHRGGATADFLRFYFQTPQGLAKLGEASPGGAGRNRTLGLKALEAIQVPTPSFDKQLWFDRLQAKVRKMRAIREQAARDADALLPAMLRETFRQGKV